MHDRATHTMSSAHQTVTLLATVAWARVYGQELVEQSTVCQRLR